MRAAKRTSRWTQSQAYGFEMHTRMSITTKDTTINAGIAARSSRKSIVLSISIQFNASRHFLRAACSVANHVCHMSFSEMHVACTSFTFATRGFAIIPVAVETLELESRGCSEWDSGASSPSSPSPDHRKCVRKIHGNSGTGGDGEHGMFQISQWQPDGYGRCHVFILLALLSTA